MYFGIYAALQRAATNRRASTTPAHEWFLAEGATGSFFTTFVLLANPTATPMRPSTVTFLPDTGQTVTRTRTCVRANALTLNIATQDAVAGERGGGDAGDLDAADPGRARAVLAGAAVELVRGAQQLRRHVAQHEMGPGRRPRRRAGRVSDLHPAGEREHDTASQVRITYLRVDGTTVVKTYTVEPTSRFNVHVNSMVPELANESFGAVIEVTTGRRHLRRARALFRSQRRAVRGRHERPGDAPALVKLVGMNRRQFLNGVAAAPAVAAFRPTFSPESGEQSSGQSAQAARGGLKLGTVTYNIAKDWDVPTLIKNLSETGFEAVELRTTHKHGVELTLSAAERAEVRKRFEDSAVKIGGLGTTCEFHAADPAVCARTWTRRSSG